MPNSSSLRSDFSRAHWYVRALGAVVILARRLLGRDAAVSAAVPAVADAQTRPLGIPVECRPSAEDAGTRS